MGTSSSAWGLIVEALCFFVFSVPDSAVSFVPVLVATDSPFWSKALCVDRMRRYCFVSVVREMFMCHRVLVAKVQRYLERGLSRVAAAKCAVVDEVIIQAYSGPAESSSRSCQNGVAHTTTS